MTLVQRVELLAKEVEKLGEGGGGGGDLSAYLTKTEASSTYETQTAASSALALKADKSTTYTKEEVDEAIEEATSTSGSIYSAWDYIPSDANPTTCEVPWSHVAQYGDFTLRKEFSPNTYPVRFSYSQGTTSNTFFYKGSIVNPGSNALETYVIEIGPDLDTNNSLVSLISKYVVNQST